jgi:hypothetical protein
MVSHLWQSLFPTRALTLEVRGDVSAAVGSIRREVANPGVQNLIYTGLLGRANESRLQVWYQRGWKRITFEPTFVGRFQTVSGRVYIVGAFGSTLSLRIFFGFLVTPIILWWIVATTAAIASGERGMPLAITFIVPPLLVALVVAEFYARRRNADRHSVLIEAVLRRAAEPSISSSHAVVGSLG